MSPALALLGLMVLGSWGVASIGLIAGGIILMFFAGDPTTASSGGVDAIGPWILLLSGLMSLGLAVVVTSPLLGLDPPIPIPAKKIIPHSRMKRWERAGALEDFPDGRPKEMRLRTLRVIIVRTGDTAYALGALCTHMRLPIASFPGAPIKPYAVQDNCVTCPFHGARFDIDTGKVTRQPWNSQFNNEHPFLGRVQSKLIPWPKRAEDIQTYPVNVENGEVFVMLPR